MWRLGSKPTAPDRGVLFGPLEAWGATTTHSVARYASRFMKDTEVQLGCASVFDLPADAKGLLRRTQSRQ
jgi:hypothetical protein